MGGKDCGNGINGMTRTVREEARPAKVWCGGDVVWCGLVLPWQPSPFVDFTCRDIRSRTRSPRNFPQENHILPQNSSTNPKTLPNTSSSGRKRTKLYQELFVRS
jgi:hypothetical protein